MMQRAASVKQVCETYGIGRSKFYELLAAGQISALKVGRKTLVEIESVEAWFVRQPRYQPRG